MTKEDAGKLIQDLEVYYSYVYSHREEKPIDPAKLPVSVVIAPELLEMNIHFSLRSRS